MLTSSLLHAPLPSRQLQGRRVRGDVHEGIQSMTEEMKKQLQQARVHRSPLSAPLSPPYPLLFSLPLISSLPPAQAREAAEYARSVVTPRLQESRQDVIAQKATRGTEVAIAVALKPS